MATSTRVQLTVKIMNSQGSQAAAVRAPVVKLACAVNVQEREFSSTRVAVSVVKRSSELTVEEQCDLYTFLSRAVYTLLQTRFEVRVKITRSSQGQRYQASFVDEGQQIYAFVSTDAAAIAADCDLQKDGVVERFGLRITRLENFTHDRVLYRGYVRHYIPGVHVHDGGFTETAQRLMMSKFIALYEKEREDGLLLTRQALRSLVFSYEYNQLVLVKRRNGEVVSKNLSRMSEEEAHDHLGTLLVEFVAVIGEQAKK
jgi:hypothetical protein